jgi:hypothetical protein
MDLMRTRFFFGEETHEYNDSMPMEYMTRQKQAEEYNNQVLNGNTFNTVTTEIQRDQWSLRDDHANIFIPSI